MKKWPGLAHLKKHDCEEGQKESEFVSQRFKFAIIFV